MTKQDTSRTFEKELKITFQELNKKYKVPYSLINKIWLLSGNYFKKLFSEDIPKCDDEIN